MAIRFACPQCRTPYTVNDRDAGKKAECKVCGQRVQVPTPPARPRTILGELLLTDGGAKVETPTPSAPPPPAPPEPARAAPPRFKAASGPQTASGPIKFACPGCQTPFTVSHRNAGKVMDCPKCGRWVQCRASLPDFRLYRPDESGRSRSGRPRNWYTPRGTSEPGYRLTCRSVSSRLTPSARLSRSVGLRNLPRLGGRSVEFAGEMQPLLSLATGG
jgi:transcription elongation factor Elf1